MPLKTTVIGAYPKPSYCNVPDWFNSFDKDSGKKTSSLLDVTEISNFHSSNDKSTVDEMIAKATEEVVKKQIDLGIDVITDGEVQRDSYYMHLIRHLRGMDMVNLVDKAMRTGAYVTKVPTVTGKIQPPADGAWCYKEFLLADKCRRKHDPENKVSMKYTLPGPMTIMDGITDQHYGSSKKRQMIEDLISTINFEIKALAQHGCKYIQIDEPVMMRYPDVAMDYGIDDVTKCFAGVKNVNKDVTTVVHLCAGYPEYLDQDGYLKAEKSNYIRLAAKLDTTGIDQASIEDAESRIDLAKVLPEFKKTTVILGAVTIARSKLESFDDIKTRITEALKYIPKERLVLAPDCGLGFLSGEQIGAKVTNMVAVAKSL